MKKKKLMTTILAVAMVIAMCFSSFAGTWRSNANGWWWENDDGSYPANTWMWIDGDNDGIAECYYFNKDGYCLINTTTPDGYQVDQNGAWIVGGDVQKQGTPVLPPEAGSDSTSSSTPKACLDDMTPDYTNYTAYKNGLESDYTSGGENWKGSIVYGVGNGNDYVIKDYYLGGQYSTLTFEAVPWTRSFWSGSTAHLTISDQETGRVLYQKDNIAADTKKFSATVDVSGVQYLRIEAAHDSKSRTLTYLLLKDQYLY